MIQYQLEWNFYFWKILNLQKIDLDIFLMNIKTRNKRFWKSKVRENLLAIVDWKNCTMT